LSHHSAARPAFNFKDEHPGVANHYRIDFRTAYSRILASGENQIRVYYHFVKDSAEQVGQDGASGLFGGVACLRSGVSLLFVFHETSMRRVNTKSNLRAPKFGRSNTHVKKWLFKIRDAAATARHRSSVIEAAFAVYNECCAS
jgi:hypothetical protein